MLLSQLIGKEIVVGKTPRGVIKGIGVSLKTHNVKYLLCTKENVSRALFAIPTSAVSIFDEGVLLPRLRPVLPKYCACIFLNLPIYSYDGEYMGALQDLTINDFIATTLFTSKGDSLPINAVAACSDALLLKKEQAYPIGQRIPAPIISHLTDKTEGVVTKPILRVAIEKRALIKLTLSLPPFSLDNL